jgi:hypothetical protein
MRKRRDAKEVMKTRQVEATGGCIASGKRTLLLET